MELEKFNNLVMSTYEFVTCDMYQHIVEYQIWYIILVIIITHSIPFLWTVLWGIAAAVMFFSFLGGILGISIFDLAAVQHIEDRIIISGYSISAMFVFLFFALSSHMLTERLWKR